jgi:hypothetical protein
MTEDLDKLHVLITSVVMFFAGAGAVHLRLWLLRRFLRQQEKRSRR